MGEVPDGGHHPLHGTARRATRRAASPSRESRALGDFHSVRDQETSTSRPGKARNAPRGGVGILTADSVVHAGGLALNFDLPEDVAMMRQVIREFVERELIPLEPRAHPDGGVPDEL